MPNKQFSVVCPVELPHNGRVLWVTVGRAFEGEDTKYAIKISLSVLPLTAFKGEPLDLFLFEERENPRSERNEPKNYRPKVDRSPPIDVMDDDGVPF